DQVHAGGGPDRRAGRSGRRERGNFGERHGRRDRAGGPGGELRGVPAGGDGGQEGGGHRARAGPVAEVHRAAWREDLGHESAGSRFDVYIRDPDAALRISDVPRHRHDVLAGEGGGGGAGPGLIGAALTERRLVTARADFSRGLDWPSATILPMSGFSSARSYRSRLWGLTITADLEDFLQTHRAHGCLESDTGDLTPNGYRLAVACSFGRTVHPRVTPRGGAG